MTIIYKQLPLSGGFSSILNALQPQALLISPYETFAHWLDAQWLRLIKNEDQNNALTKLCTEKEFKWSAVLDYILLRKIRSSFLICKDIDCLHIASRINTNWNDEIPSITTILTRLNERTEDWPIWNYNGQWTITHLRNVRFRDEISKFISDLLIIPCKYEESRRMDTEWHIGINKILPFPYEINAETICKHFNDYTMPFEMIELVKSLGYYYENTDPSVYPSVVSRYSVILILRRSTQHWLTEDTFFNHRGIILDSRTLHTDRIQPEDLFFPCYPYDNLTLMKKQLLRLSNIFPDGIVRLNGDDPVKLQELGGLEYKIPRSLPSTYGLEGYVTLDQTIEIEQSHGSPNGKKVIFQEKVFQTLIECGTKYTDPTIQKEQWRMVMGLFFGYISKDIVIVKSAEPISYGSATGVEMANEDYVRVAELEMDYNERGEFVVGWFHTRPLSPLYLSNNDSNTLRGHQVTNPAAFAMVYDPLTIENNIPKFEVYRLTNITEHNTNNYKIDYEIQKDISQYVNPIHDDRMIQDERQKVDNTENEGLVSEKEDVEGGDEDDSYDQDSDGDDSYDEESDGDDSYDEESDEDDNYDEESDEDDDLEWNRNRLNHRDSEFDTEGKYTKTFPFVKENIFLIARIEPDSLRQLLTFQKVNESTGRMEYSDTLECIHTAITRISYEEYENLIENPEDQQDFIKKKLNIESSENIPNRRDFDRRFNRRPFEGEIDLDVDEKFFAFKSWVQGISEAGIDALYLQSEIDQSMEGSLPIAQFLFRNLIRVDCSFLTQFLDKIERECKFEGVYHKSSIRANLDIILPVISELIYFENEEGKIRWEDEVDSKKIIECLVRIAELDAEFLFQYDNPNSEFEYDFRLILANISELMEYTEYRALYTAEEFEIRKVIVSNPLSAYYPEFVEFFDDEDPEIRKIAASNPKAADFPAFKKLFTDPDGEVRWEVVNNKRSIEFPEYVKFFTDEDDEIKYTALDNEKLLETPYYKSLFTHEDSEIRRSIAINPKSVDIPEYKALFFDSDSYVRIGVVDNPRSIELPEYKALFKDEDDEVRKEVAYDSRSVDFPEFQLFFTDKSDEIRKVVAGYPKSIDFPEYKILFTDEDPKIRRIVAQNPKAVGFSEFKLLFKDEDSLVRQIIAENPRMVEYPEYDLLIKDIDRNVRKAVAKNPSALKKAGYENLSKDLSFDVRRAYVQNSNYAPVVGQRFLFPKEWGVNIIDILKHDDAIKFGEYDYLFVDEDENIRMLMITDVNAVDFLAFKNLYKKAPKNIQDSALKTIIKKANLLIKKREYEKAINLYNEAISIADDLQEGHLKIDILNRKAKAQIYAKNFISAQKTLEETKAIAEKVDNRLDLSNFFQTSAELYLNQSKYDDALGFALKALDLAKTIQDQENLARKTNYLGIIYLFMKSFQKALVQFQEALTIFHQLDDDFNCAIIYGNIADTYKQQNDFKQAIKNYNVALNISKDFKFTDLIMENSYYLASIQADQFDFENGLKNIQTSIDYAIELKDDYQKMISLVVLGKIQFNQGNYNKSLRVYQEAIEICAALGNIINRTDALVRTAEILIKIQQQDKAIQKIQEACSILEKIENSTEKARIQNNIGKLQHNLGRYSQAIDTYTECFKLFEKLNDQRMAAILLNNIGCVYLSERNNPTALRYCLDSLKKLENFDDIPTKIRILMNIGNIYQAQGNQVLSLGAYDEAIFLVDKNKDPVTKCYYLNEIAKLPSICQDDKLFNKIIDKMLSLIELEDSQSASFKSQTYNFIGTLYRNRYDDSNYRSLHNRSLYKYTKEEVRNYEICATYQNILRRFSGIFSEMGKIEKEVKNFTEKNNIPSIMDPMTLSYYNALIYYKKALNISKESKDLGLSIGILLDMASIYKGLDDHDELKRIYGEALNYTEKLGDTRTKGIILNNYGDLYRSEQNFEVAIKYYQQSYTTLNSIDDSSAFSVKKSLEDLKRGEMNNRL